MGSLNSSYEARMGLISVHPAFNPYNCDRPIPGGHGLWPPARAVHDRQGGSGRWVRSPHAVVGDTIMDKNVAAVERRQIGVNLERDRGRYKVTERGVIVGKGQKVEA